MVGATCSFNLLAQATASKRLDSSGDHESWKSKAIAMLKVLLAEAPQHSDKVARSEVHRKASKRQFPSPQRSQLEVVSIYSSYCPAMLHPEERHACVLFRDELWQDEGGSCFGCGY